MMKICRTPIFISIVLTMLSCNLGGKGKNKTGDSTQVQNYKNDTVQMPWNKDSIVAGIDISQYQGDEMDFLTRRQNQLTFVICKATEGVTYTDPEFVNNWKLIPQKGFTRGVYHFYHCTDDPIAQANFFLSTVGTMASTDLPPIVDFEELSLDPSCSTSQIQANLLLFLKTVQQKTGRLPMIYTDLNVGNAQLKDPAFAQYPLWVADYNGEALPATVTTWGNNNWTFWQKTDNYKEADDNNIMDDFDVFHGNGAEFLKFLEGK
jgi:lysozyme